MGASANSLSDEVREPGTSKPAGSRAGDRDSDLVSRSCGDPDAGHPDRSHVRSSLRDPEQVALAAVLIGCLSVLVWWYWELVTRQPAEFLIERTSDGIGYQIDINSATWVELQQLEAIGPVLAKRIVANRDQNGPFSTIDDLQRVSGIGPRTVDRNRRWMKAVPVPLR